MRDMKKTYAEI